MNCNLCYDTGILPVVSGPEDYEWEQCDSCDLKEPITNAEREYFKREQACGSTIL